MKIDFKNYHCFFCKNQKLYKKTIYKRIFIGNLFKVLVCSNCKCEFTNLIPKNKDSWINLYKLGGSDQKIKNPHFFGFLSLIFHKLRYFQLVKIKNIIIKHSTFNKSKLLDYGTGDGYLANHFSKISFETSATDINSTRPPFLDERIHYYKNNKLNNKKFDVIVLRHVLEHVEDPIDLIENLTNNLQRNGFFYIEVPNHDKKTNLFLKIFRENYSQLGLPYHVNHFNLKSFLKSFSKKYKIYSYKLEVPVLGDSIKNIFFEENPNKFSLINVALFPLQKIIHFFMHKNTVYGFILFKR